MLIYTPCSIVSEAAGSELASLNGAIPIRVIRKVLEKLCQMTEEEGGRNLQLIQMSLFPALMPAENINYCPSCLICCLFASVIGLRAKS